jgi:hypothetical protein
MKLAAKKITVIGEPPLANPHPEFYLAHTLNPEPATVIRWQYPVVTDAVRFQHALVEVSTPLQVVEFANNRDRLAIHAFGFN